MPRSQRRQALIHPEPDEFDVLDILLALSDPTRMTIVQTLRDTPERACGSFPVDVAPSTLTHHFRVLREAGVIRQREEGNRRWTTLRDEDLQARFPGFLDTIMTAYETALASPGDRSQKLRLRLGRTQERQAPFAHGPTAVSGRGRARSTGTPRSRRCRPDPLGRRTDGPWTPRRALPCIRSRAADWVAATHVRCPVRSGHRTPLGSPEAERPCSQVEVLSAAGRLGACRIAGLRVPATAAASMSTVIAMMLPEGPAVARR